MVLLELAGVKRVRLPLGAFEASHLAVVVVFHPVVVFVLSYAREGGENVGPYLGKCSHVFFVVAPGVVVLANEYAVPNALIDVEPRVAVGRLVDLFSLLSPNLFDGSRCL